MVLLVILVHIKGGGGTCAAAADFERIHGLHHVSSLILFGDRFSKRAQAHRVNEFCMSFQSTTNR